MIEKLRTRCIQKSGETRAPRTGSSWGRADYSRKQPGLAVLTPQQTQQLWRIQLVPANLHAIQQQDRNMQPIAALQRGVGIDVDQLQSGQIPCVAQFRQRFLQLLAQSALRARQ